jgi:hypothetical protein
VLFGFKRWETIKELIAKDAQAPYVYMVIMFRLLHWTNCNKLRGKKKHIGKFRVFGFSINQFRKKQQVLSTHFRRQII